jgi:hypothetical protein
MVNWDREMSKIIFLMIIAGLVVVALAALNINDVNAHQQSEFIQISVLAENHADYGVNEKVVAIPAVSVKIIEAAAQDFQTQSSVRIITYTSLPTKEPKSENERNSGSEAIDEIKHDNDQGNSNGNNGNGDSNTNNGNGNNGNSNNNQKDKDKDKDKEKDKGNGGGGGNEKDKEKNKDNGGGGGNDNEKSNENKSEKKE